MADIRQAIEYARQNPNSAYAAELRRRMESGQLDSQLSSAGFKSPKDPSFLSRVGDALSTFFSDTGKDVAETGKEVASVAVDTAKGVKDAAAASIKGEQGMLRGAAQGIGRIAGGLSKGLGALVKGAGKVLVPQNVEDAAGKATEAVGEAVAGNEFVKTQVSRYNALPDAQKRDVDALLGVSSLALDLTGAGLAGKPVTKAAQAGIEGAIASAEAAAKAAGGAVADAGAAAARAVAPVVTPVVDAAKGAATLAREVGESAARIPSNVRTNLAARQAARDTIESLPTETAKLAAKDGVAVSDARAISSFAGATEVDKAAARRVSEAVRKVAAGEAEPEAALSAIGDQITQRVKTLRRAEEKVGAALGESARTLPVMEAAELTNPVLSRLQAVPGLKALKLAKDGTLDFSGTTLSTGLTAADRRAIQTAFGDATRWGSGLKKHRLRQELREVITGKKQGSVAITTTQEEAFNAIRGGLLDAISAKVPRYGTLSKQFARLADPADRLNKILRATGATDDEILSIKGASIARRLTSNAPSRADLREILNAMDEALGTAKGSAASVARLQDFYNVLEQYYDIAPRTGFQGQAKAAFEGSSAADIASRSVARVAGQTPEVRRAALEKLIDEALGASAAR